jgi:hypothetical protein
VNVIDKTRFCDDDELGYRSHRGVFAPGEGLRLDAAYRLAHLPLVAPEHPDVIPAAPNRPYAMGRRPAAWSLVAPIPWSRLEASASYRELDYALRGAPFAGKIAWEIAPLRQQRLHATLAGSLSAGEEASSPIDDATRARIARLAPFEMELRGLFSGDVNVGRLYLKCYPERRDGENALHAAQDAVGRPRTRLHLVGLHNLRDHLTAREASALAEIIAAWWDRPLLRWRIDRLHLQATRDDIALDGWTAEEIALVG